MVATTDFLPVATAGGANVDTQGNFAGSGYQTQGFAAGLAQSKQMNKVFRQSSMMAAAWAQFCVGQGISVPDDGNLPNLQTNIQSALLAFIAANGIGFTTGDLKPTWKTVADPGWVLINDGSVGDAASNATTRANNDTVNLFALVWGNIGNANAPIQDSTGAPVARGASAAIDFAAHRRLVLPKALGRALALAGAGAGLTLRSLGDIAGAESSAIANSNLPADGFGRVVLQSTGGGGSQGLINSILFGGGVPLPTLTPSTFVNMMVKL